MTQAWIVDLIVALIMGAITVGFVLVAGGPGWAAVGFGMVVYLTRERRRQEATSTSPTVINLSAAEIREMGSEELVATIRRVAGHPVKYGP